MRPFVVISLISGALFLAPLKSAQAVNIAIFDTGADAGICVCPLEPESFDFINNDAIPNDESSNFHGNAVANVAFNSGAPISITAIKMFADGFETTPGISSAAMAYVANLPDVQVTVHSGAQLLDTPVAELQAITNSGKISVFQAGNQATASPFGDGSKVGQLGGRGIVVGGLTPDGENIQVFSARAGFQKDHYIMADTRSLITGSNGTSMAAPRVGAAAATVWAQHQFLTPEQVVSILFDTARDLGEPGNDFVYGHGALDLDAALAAAGSGQIPSEGSGDGGGGGGGAGLAVAGLAVAGAGIYALMNKNEEELQRTIMVDSYGRAFQFGLADRITVRDPRPSIFSMYARQQIDADTVILNQTENSYTQAFVTKAKVNPYQYTAGDKVEENYISFLNRTELPDSYYAMALNSDLSKDFGALSFRNRTLDDQEVRFSSNQLFSTPVLGYSSLGTSFMYGWNNSGVDHRLGLSVIDEQRDHGLVSNSILLETTKREENYKVGFQMGALIENGSFLGGSSDSALGVDETATYYLGLNGSWNVTNDITLLGGYFQGMSDVDESSASLLSSFSNIRTEGYAVGMIVDDLFSPRGSFGFSYSSPLQTISGTATLTLPVSQNMNTGAIGFESTNLSYADADKEKVIEAYYNYQINRKNSVFTHLSHTKNPLTDLSRGSTTAMFLGWRHNFN